MVGRHEELTVVDRLFAGLERGDLPVVAVAGEAGIGKSRLLLEVAELASERGYLVVEGRAMEFEREVPFAPIVAALDDVVEAMGCDQLEPLGTERLSELRRIFPSLEGAGGDPSGLEAERYRLHRAIRSLLETLTVDRPLVVVLDDVHWADAATLELLIYLLHRPPRGPVMLALGYRDRQVSDRLVAAFGRAAHDRVKVELRTLKPLTRSEIGELLTESSLDVASLREVHERSGGNPFYAEQLARTGVSEPVGHGLRDKDRVPAELVAAVFSEVETLGPEASALLRGAAVAGDPFEVDLAAAAADVDVAGVGAPLDALAAVGLVRPAPPGPRFRFRHPIVRTAIYEGAGTGWRLEAHARVAASLKERGAPASARAHHVERAARPGDEEARQVLLVAAEEAMARAPAAAVRWYTAALELTVAGKSEQSLDILVALAGALAAAGRRELAHARLLEALRLVPEGDRQRWVELTALCAGIENQIGRPAEANARLVAALQALPEDATAARAELEVELAVQPAYLADWKDVSERGQRGLAIAKASGDPALLANASSALALGATFTGSYEAAVQHADRAASLLDQASDAAVSTSVAALLYVGVAETFLDRYDAARRHVSRALEVSRATRYGRFLTPILASLARLEGMLGRFEPAREHAEGAVDAARVGGDRQALLWGLGCVALVEWFAGDAAAAHGPGHEAYELAHGHEGVIAATAICNHAAVCDREGDHERCVALMYEAGVVEATGPLRAQLWEPLVRSLMELGRIDEARAVLGRLRARLGAADPAMVRAGVDRADAVFALAQGDGEAATRSARSALQHAQSRDARVDVGLSRILLGRALALVDDPDQAIAELEVAHRDLDAIGATGHRDAAAAELRALGQHVSRRSRRAAGESATASLTGRELEVAELTADGLTNKQIAARLYLSDRTVESHLSRVFEKLGVANRAAVGARLLQPSERVTTRPSSPST